MGGGRSEGAPVPILALSNLPLSVPGQFINQIADLTTKRLVLHELLVSLRVIPKQPLHHLTKGIVARQARRVRCVLPTVLGVWGTSNKQNTRSPHRTCWDVPMSDENFPSPVDVSRTITPCLVRESRR